MTIRSGDRFILNLEHPEIMRAVLAQIVRTGDVLGRGRAAPSSRWRWTIG
jgi:hypothetical protein